MAFPHGIPDKYLTGEVIQSTHLSIKIKLEILFSRQNRIEHLENTIKIYLIQPNKIAAIPGRFALC